MATKSQTVAGLTAGRSTNESLEARRRREAAAKAQATAGFTAGRTTPPKATNAQAITPVPQSTGVPGGSAGVANSIVSQTAANPVTSNIARGDSVANSMATLQNAPPSYSNAPTGDGWNGGSTNAINGYLKQFGYTPEGLMGLYDNPTPLANDVLGTRGIQNHGMGQQLADLFDHFLGAQFVNNRGEDNTDNDTLNFIARAMQQAITPGGQYVDPAYYLNTILGATNPDANALGQYLDTGTGTQQVSNTNRLASQGLVGMNPYAQSAYAGALQRQGENYLGAMAKGDPNSQSYVDYLRQSPFANWF
jgi:hypothetical protein